MPKKKRKVKRRTKKPKPKAANKKAERWFLIVMAVLIIFAIVLSVPSNDWEKISQEEQSQQQTTIETTYPCGSSLECFLISCRDTPSVVECVNAITTDTYGRDVCGSYAKVTVPYRDYTRCICVQGLCKLIK